MDLHEHATRACHLPEQVWWARACGEDPRVAAVLRHCCSLGGQRGASHASVVISCAVLGMAHTQQSNAPGHECACHDAKVRNKEQARKIRLALQGYTGVLQSTDVWSFAHCSGLHLSRCCFFRTRSSFHEASFAAMHSLCALFLFDRIEPLLRVSSLREVHVFPLVRHSIFDVILRSCHMLSCKDDLVTFLR